MSAPPTASLLRGLALGAAFSPVLLGLGRSLAEDHGHRFILLTPLLIASLLFHGVAPSSGPSPASRAPRIGLALIATGIALELIGLATSTALIARLGLPLAFCGLALFDGRPDLRVALLAFGLVPIPDFVKTLSSPFAEMGFAGGLARIWTVLGAAVEARGPLLVAEGRTLELAPTDAGLVTAILLAEWGAYRALRAGGDVARMFVGALRSALGVVVVQPLVGGAAVGILILGFPASSRFFLYHAVTLGLAGLVLATHLAPRRATRPGRHEAPDRAPRQAR